MVKKTLVNKKVVKALTIALSVTLAAQPLTAAAAEIEAEVPVQPHDHSTEEDTAAKTVVDGAQGLADKALTDENKADKSAVNTQQRADNLYNETKDENVKKVSDDEKAVKESDSIEKIDKNTFDGDAKDATKDVDSHLAQAEAGLIAGEKATEDAIDAANDMDKAVSAVESAGQATEETIQNDINAIKTSTTIPEATEAYKDAEKTYEDYCKLYDEELANYETAKKALETAKENVASAQSVYDLAIEQGLADAQIALDELNAAIRLQEIAKTDAEAAYNNFVAAGYGKIALLEQETKNATKWSNTYDELFNAILENYYIPAHYDVDPATMELDLPRKGKKGPEDWIVTKGTTENNYCVVSFTTKDGERVSLELNYVLSNQNKQGGIIIFEKAEFFDADDLHFQLSDAEKAALAAGNEVTKTFENRNVVIVANEDGTGYVVVDAKSATAATTLGENQTVANEQTTWSFDDEGNLVKTVTGDVTTTTTTGKTLTGGSGYATEAAARTAAAAEAANMLDEGATIADGSLDVTVTETAGEYTATVYYTKKFTKEVDINGTYDGWTSPVTHSAKEAKENATESVTGTIDGDTYRITNVKSELSATAQTGKISFVTYETGNYTVNGKVTVEYIECVEATENYSNILDFIGLGASKEQITAQIDAKLAAEGKVRISNVDGWDMKAFKATYYYATLYSETATGATEEEAIANAKAKVTDAHSWKDSKTETSQSGSTYSYTGSFNQTKTETEEDVTLYTTEWSTSEQYQTTRVLTNDNYRKGDILFAEYFDNLDRADKNDEEKADYMVSKREGFNLTEKQVSDTVEFRAKVAEAEALRVKYEDLKKKAISTTNDFKAAKQDVEKLIASIEKLKLTNVDGGNLRELESQLEELQKRFEQLKEEKEVIDELIEKAREEYRKAVDRLTPPATPAEEGGEEEGGPVVLPPTVPVAPLAAAPAAPAALAAPAAVAAPAVAETTTIAEPETALAATPEEVKEDAELTDIQDTETALAAAPIDEEHLSWWWLLIVALLGGAGYAMYKKNQEKKAKETTDK